MLLLCIIIAIISRFVNAKWEPIDTVDGKNFEEAMDSCRNRSLWLPGSMTRRDYTVLKEFMKRRQINRTWLSLQRTLYDQVKPVIHTDRRPEPVNNLKKGGTCLTVEKGKERAVLCNASVHGALCETTDCSWCHPWNCRLLPRGCIRHIYASFNWYNARAECRHLGGHLAVDKPSDSWGLDTQKEYWIGWTSAEWFFVKPDGEKKLPNGILFSKKSVNTHNCTTVTTTETEWTVTDCSTKMTAVCGRLVNTDENNTGNVSATAGGPITFFGGPNITKNKPCTSPQSYTMWLGVVVSCAIVAVISTLCCACVTCRAHKILNLRTHNAGNNGDTSGRSTRPRTFIETLQRSARWLSPLYSEVNDNGWRGPTETVLTRQEYPNQTTLPATSYDEPLMRFTEVEQFVEYPYESCPLSSYTPQTFSSHSQADVIHAHDVFTERQNDITDYSDVMDGHICVENNPVYVSQF